MLRLILSLLIAPLLAMPAAAQAVVPNWNARKCAAYGAPWDQAVEAFGTSGVGPDFIAGNKRFIAGGCAEALNLCPHSARELDIAPGSHECRDGQHLPAVPVSPSAGDRGWLDGSGALDGAWRQL